METTETATFSQYCNEATNNFRKRSCCVQMHDNLLKSIASDRRTFFTRQPKAISSETTAAHANTFNCRSHQNKILIDKRNIDAARRRGWGESREETNSNMMFCFWGYIFKIEIIICLWLLLFIHSYLAALFRTKIHQHTIVHSNISISKTRPFQCIHALAEHINYLPFEYFI